jgi:hypothetical protein
MRGIFLDDVRKPEDAAKYVKGMGINPDIYIKGEIEWHVVRDFYEFAHDIKINGIPDVVSFDHDLADEHYTPEQYWHDFDASKDYQEKKGYGEPTGYECALYLAKVCAEQKKELPLWVVHSMNPVGAARIRNYLRSLS